MPKYQKSCSDEHEKIAFWSAKCPLCAVKDALQRVNDAVMDAMYDCGVFEIKDEPQTNPTKAGVLVDIGLFRRNRPSSSPTDVA